MHLFLSQMYHNILYGTFCILALLLVKNFMLKRHGQYFYYYCWIIPMFAFLNPLSFIIGIENIGIREILLVSTASRYREYVYAILLVWCIGVVASAVRYMVHKRRITRFLLDEMRPADAMTQSIFEESKAKLKITKKVDIGIAQITRTPVLLFSKTPTVLLPDVLLNQIELRMVLLHELHHLRSHDSIVKGFGSLIGILFWWNPIVYVMLTQLEEACELACDRRVLCGASKDEKLLYSQAVLNFAKGVSHNQSTGQIGVISMSAHAFEKRFSLMIQPVRPAKKILFVILILLMSIGNLITIRDSSPLFLPNDVYLSNDFEIVRRFDGYYDVYLGDDMVAFSLDEQSISLFHNQK